MELNDQDTIVAASNLVKRYGTKSALDGLSLGIRASGITAILGANGAGKTTLIRCVLGLTAPSAGMLSVFGQAPGSREARTRTGVMLQDADLPDLLTPREHLTLFASYYDRPLPVTEAITTCDIGAFADTRYKALSGGQKRRVQFALAVIGQPDLLFLDEPTTGLDGDARRALWQTVRRLAEGGASIVLTTHYLEEADALADHIVILKDGRVLTEAPTPQIRSAVGGALIRCSTTLALADVRPLAGVRLGADPSPQDLTVTKPSLEEAVADLEQPSA